MSRFAGFERGEIAGVPVLSKLDRRFKTFRFALYTRRTHDERAAARSLLPSLLLMGTERDVDRPAIARRMQDLYGASVQPIASKIGESHVLCFALDSVSGARLPERPDQLGDGLTMLSDLLARPRLDAGGFPADVFERERAQAVNAIRTLRDDKGNFALERAIEIACAGEPMAIPEHGGLDAVEALDRCGPEVARGDFLEHGRMWSVAMGDLPEPAEFEARVAAFLSELPERDELEVAEPVAVEERTAGRTVERVELRQSKLVMVFRMPRVEDPRLRVGRNLFVSMFGGGPNSRLFEEVREKRSLAYYAASSLERHKGLLIVQVGLDGDAVVEAEEEIRRQLRLLCSGEFSDQEFETARRMMSSSLTTVDDSIAQRVRFTSEQWLHGNDRAPEEVAMLCQNASRADAIEAAEGVWLDHSYVLTDGDAE